MDACRLLGVLVFLLFLYSWIVMDFLIAFGTSSLLNLWRDFVICFGVVCASVYFCKEFLYMSLTCFSFVWVLWVYRSVSHSRSWSGELRWAWPCTTCWPRDRWGDWLGRSLKLVVPNLLSFASFLRVEIINQKWFASFHSNIHVFFPGGCSNKHFLDVLSIRA